MLKLQESLATVSRTELRCDASRRATPQDIVRSDILTEAGLEPKCGKLLTRSPELGERVQWLTPLELCGEIYLVDHYRHLACVYVTHVDGLERGEPYDSETVAWTALRPCNGEPVR